MSNFKARFLNSLIQTRCFICESTGESLCSPCRKSLPWQGDAVCPHCALPSVDAQICGSCLKMPPTIDRSRAACRFAYPIASLIHAFKYDRARWLGPHLARLLQDSLPENHSIDAIMPMPIDPARLRERGFNQALDLAKPLAKALALPLTTRIVVRKSRAQHQAGLNFDERKRNVRGIFELQAQPPRRIALVDDVMTSSASMNELARTLRAGGAEHIEAWILARTYPLTDA